MLLRPLSITIESYFADQQRRVAKPSGVFLGRGQVKSSFLSVYKSADLKAMQVSQFLYGECFDYFHEDALPINWYLVQSRRDHYVGYIHSDNVERPSFTSNAKIVKLSSAIYQYPNFKSNILCQLPLGSELQVDVDHQLNMQGIEEDGEYIYSPALQGWIYKAHLQFDDQLASNPIPIARQFIGQSYLWGGRSGWGCDCSSLVQLCYELCGCVLPRDTHLQRLYAPAFEEEEVLLENIQSGDLIYWSGHVAIASSTSHLIHATCSGMHVVEEPINKVCQRISAEKSEQLIVVLRPKSLLPKQ